MRCIEISLCSKLWKWKAWLIETWDVLKWTNGNAPISIPFMINRNMRCIEMILDRYAGQGVEVINRNMRCIEIRNL